MQVKSSKRFFFEKKTWETFLTPWNQPTLAQKNTFEYICFGSHLPGWIWRSFGMTMFQGIMLRDASEWCISRVSFAWICEWWMMMNTTQQISAQQIIWQMPPCSSFLAFYIYLENLVLWIYKYWSIYMYIYIYTSFSLPSSPFGLVITPHFRLQKTQVAVTLGESAFPRPNLQGAAGFFNTAKGRFFFSKRSTVIFAAKNT